MTGRHLSRWQADRLARLLDALDGVPLTDEDRRMLAWLAGFDASTVRWAADLIRRAREVGP